LPPYLNVDIESVINNFEKVDWTKFNRNNPLEFLDFLNTQKQINYPALAAIDMPIF
jgi:hypothetical protein